MTTKRVGIGGLLNEAFPPQRKGLEQFEDLMAKLEKVPARGVQRERS